MLRLLVDREYVADEYFSGQKLHTTSRSIFPTITRTNTDTDFNHWGQLSPECEILIAQPRVVRCRGEGDGDVDAEQKKRRGTTGRNALTAGAKKRAWRESRKVPTTVGVLTGPSPPHAPCRQRAKLVCIFGSANNKYDGPALLRLWLDVFSTRPRIAAYGEAVFFSSAFYHSPLLEAFFERFVKCLVPFTNEKRAYE